MIGRLLFKLASPAGIKARLSILIFHRVLPEPDPLFPDEMHAERFDAVCGWLARWFQVLPLDEAVRRLQDRSLPARAACITFDDGYADNHSVALPILQRHGLTSTFFIATGFLDGGRMWNDSIIESIRGCRSEALDLESLGLGRHALSSVGQRRVAIESLIGQIKYRPVDERIRLGAELAARAGVQLPDDLMMNSGDVQAMHRAGMQIGAHSVSHPILARLPDDAARREITQSKRFLENLLDTRIGLFAYPNGKPGEDYSPRTVELVREAGFDAAVSTAIGTSRSGDDMFQLRRFTPWDAASWKFGARLLWNLQGN